MSLFSVSGFTGAKEDIEARKKAAEINIDMLKNSKPASQQLIEHLELIQSNFTKSLKLAYFHGFRDAREEDYLGCDVMARWESSEVKQEIDKNENI